MIPNGIPSVEERVKLLYTHGVAKKRISLETLVRCASTEAAKIFGLYPQKGTVAVGSDADLVIWDPTFKGTISVETHSMATDYSAFEGWEHVGRAEIVTVRGEVVVREGAFVGTPGNGRMLRRSPGYL
jgi:dihydropyrimidinase